MPSRESRKPRSARKDADPSQAHLAQLEGDPARLGASRRRVQGSHYTPAPLVSWLLDAVDETLERVASPTLLDPACGTGHFLVEAAQRMQGRGAPAAEVLASRLFGVDLDRGAVEICRTRLLALLPSGTSSTERRRVRQALRRHVVVADALEQGPIAALRAAGARIESFDAVIGNPPFLSRLESATALDAARVDAVRARHPGGLGRYGDAACAFALDALAALAPGGALAFVMPQSFLSAAEAGPTRARLVADGRIGALWTCAERIFPDAQVAVCAMCVVRGASRGGDSMRRAFGAGFAALPAWRRAQPSGEASWAPILAEGAGVPEIAIRSGEGEVLATIATATADFRDQYYGLDGAIVEHARPSRGARPMLVTTRHIDLARCSWGDGTVRVLGERWTRPCVDAARLAANGKMTRWMRARLVPKVVVATQTRILEAAVDATGAWLPLVPLISVVPREPGDAALWRVAAAIASPVAVVHAARNLFGSAMSPGALKLSAKQVLALPLPTERSAWEASAHELRSASEASGAGARAAALERFAHRSCAAHGLGTADAQAVLRFWLGRAGLGPAGLDGDAAPQKARRPRVRAS